MWVTVDGKRSGIATGRSCEPEKWSISACRSTGRMEDSRTLNAYLSDLQNKIYEIHRQLILKDETVTADIIRDKFFSRAPNCQRDSCLNHAFFKSNKSIIR